MLQASPHLTLAVWFLGDGHHSCSYFVKISSMAEFLFLPHHLTMKVTPYPCIAPHNFHIVLFFWLHLAACEILVPRPGIEPMPLQWKHRVLTTGPPGRSLHLTIFFFFHLTIFKAVLHPLSQPTFKTHSERYDTAWQSGDSSSTANDQPR